MLTMNQTPGTDNKAILVLKIELEDRALYFSDTLDKITLSGIDFDGKVLYKGSLSDLTEYVDISEGGGIGTVGHFSFSIARYNTYTGTSNFINDFFPATGQPLLTSKTVDVGIVWTGATSLEDITWLKRYGIEDHSWSDTQLNLSCIEFDELAATMLPYYRIQDQVPNDVSYNTDLTDETRGKTIPIIYGDFTELNLEYGEANLSPAVRAGKGFSFIVASHLCKETTSTNRLYEHLSEVNAYLSIYGADVSIVNKWNLHRVDMNTHRDINLYGELILKPSFATSEYGFLSPSDAANCMDGSDTSFMTLQAGQQVGLVLPANIPSNLFGDTDGTVNSCSFNVRWSSAGSSTQNIHLSFWHVEKENFSGVWQNDSTNNVIKDTQFVFGDGTQVVHKRDTSAANWNIDELQKLYYSIKNTGTGPIRIYNCYVKFNQLKIYEIFTVPKGQGMLITRGNRRLMYGEGKYIFTNDLNNTKDLFSPVKGYEFDGWIQ